MGTGPPLSQAGVQADRRLRPAIWLAKLGLAGLLLWLIHRLGYIRWAPIAGLLQKPWLLSGLVILEWTSIPLCAARWFWLMRAQRLQVSFGDAFRTLYVSNFVGLFLPGMIGGDAARIAFGIPLTPKAKTALVISIMIDRLMGLFGLLVLGLVATLVLLAGQGASPGNARILWGSLGLMVAAITTGIASWRFSAAMARSMGRVPLKAGSLVSRLLAGVISALEGYRHQGRLLAGVAVFSVLVHAKDIVVLVLVGEAMGLDTPEMAAFAWAGTVVLFLNFVPLTPQGLGFGEAAFAQLGSLLQPSRSMAGGSIVLAKRGVTLISLLPATLIWLAGGFPRNRRSGK